MVEAMAMVDVVSKPDAEETMIVAVVIAQGCSQAKQSSRAHVKHSKGTFLTALTTAKLTNMPLH